jgi:DNA invertase Pin-like site-specific DNA recombinase
VTRGGPTAGGPSAGGPRPVIGYAWVSADELAHGGPGGLADQQQAIAAGCQERGLRLVEVVGETSSAPSRERPRLNQVLDRLDLGDAVALVVASLDRLSWSVRDLAALVERARRGRWAIIALDLHVDTSTPAGETVADVVATLARLERLRASQRSREALSEKRAQGARLGRPQHLSPEIIERIVGERSAGKSLPKIAEGLNRDGVATAQGGRRWYASTVRAALGSQR